MRRDADRLQDMLDAIAAIRRRAMGGRDAFDADEMLQVWCLRHIEVIGEAAARVSEEVRARHPDVPWQEIVGMRNALVHGYFDVDWQEVWNVVDRDLGLLKDSLERALAGEQSE